MKILSRYHIISMMGIVGLGLIGNYALPVFSIGVPWTIFLLIMTGGLTSAVFAFSGAARYSSMALAAENVRLSRFPQPVRYVSDGKITWAFVPVKGWTYMQTFVNSGGNPGVAILPAFMLEQELEYYTVARCHLYHLTPRAVRTLMRKKAFGKVLAELGYSTEGEDKKMDVYFGFHSKTLHPDSDHIKSPADLAAYARSLSTDEREYSRVSIELSNQLNRQLELWRRVQGSNEAHTIVRREQLEAEQ